ncbi:MAG: hypothetical protein KDK63_05080 [Chlamydiia bacterium]|nr:hypothetical protein [Chlamydiia bacterium]
MNSTLISKGCALLLFLGTMSTLVSGENHQSGYPGMENRWTLSADLLYWYPSEEVTAIWADVVTTTPEKRSWKAPGFEFKWDVGFRIGAGHHFEYDLWDTKFYWTYFRTASTHALSAKPNTSIGAEFFAALLSGDTPRHLKVKWSLFFNMFDWELGRRTVVSKNLSIRPFIGVKGGWINQDIDATNSDLIVLIFPTEASARERLKNNFWGIGPQGGLHTKWNLYRSLSLLGDFSLASMWGSWRCSDVYKTSFATKSTVNTKDSHLGALMYQGFMGLGWEMGAHCSAKLGYEMQIWLNQLRIATFQLQRLHGDLTFTGVTLRCRLDF